MLAGTIFSKIQSDSHQMSYIKSGLDFEELGIFHSRTIDVILKISYCVFAKNCEDLKVTLQ